MVSHRGNRYSIQNDMDNLSSLSTALARVQRLTGSNAITMARKIGFAIGLDLASKRTQKNDDIHSELSLLFRRLNLGRVILRQWGPVVFATRTGSRTQSVQTAFGEGVLEGLVHAHSKKRVFVRHSIVGEKTTSSFSDQKPRIVEKL